VVHQEQRDSQQVGISQILDSVALKGAQVVGVAKLGPQALEDLPVTRLALGAEGLLEVAPKITFDPVVVEQSVVDVEQKNEVVWWHLAVLLVPAGRAGGSLLIYLGALRRRCQIGNLPLDGARRPARFVAPVGRC